MNDTSQNAARLSLPTGSTLRSGSHIYQVNDILSESPRSLTVSCQNERSQHGRLKFFNGASSVTLDLLEQVARLDRGGILRPVDAGTHSGHLFAVYPRLDVQSADRLVFSPETLSDHLIPQMNEVIHRFHASGLLLRDICPEHILCHKQKIAYCGLSNLTALRGGATTTGEPGYGQEEAFLSPETRQGKFSVASDYYALGITLLRLLRIPAHSSGSLEPGRVQRLQNTPYALYTLEDRILYLIQGLTLPDPKQRWGWEETRVWCAGHLIPWTQPNGRRTVYDFTDPFPVRNMLCWNRQQLARELSRDREAWTEQGVQKTCAFLTRQGIPLQTPTLSPAGTMFRCLYTLNPSLDGLRWKGEYFYDMEALLQRVERDRGYFDELCQMLRESCFSFLFQIRAGQNPQFADTAAQFAELEAWEREEAGKGANRCLMRFASDSSGRWFVVDGHSFATVKELLNHYNMDGTRLRNHSAELLRDGRFQAWVWFLNPGINLEKVRQTLSAHPNQSFFLLMSLLETMAASEEERRAIREFYLHWGEVAPLVWLERNLDRYQALSNVFRARLRKEPVLTADRSLSDLSALSAQAQADYLDFAAHTADNPFTAANAASELSDMRFLPRTKDCFFSCRWEEFSVCPAFLGWISKPISIEAVDLWLNSAANAEELRLSIRETQWRNLAGTQGVSAGDYEKECERNLASALLLLIFETFCVAFGMFRAGGFQWPFLLPLPLCVPFPLAALVWYYSKRMQVGVLIRQQRDAQSQIENIAQKRALLQTLKQSIRQEIQQHLSVTQEVSTLEEPVPPSGPSVTLSTLTLPVSYRILAFLCLLGCTTLWLMTIPAFSWHFWSAYYQDELPQELLKIVVFSGIYGVLPLLLMNRENGFFPYSFYGMMSVLYTVLATAIFRMIPIQADFLMTGIMTPVAILVGCIVIAIVMAVAGG